MTDKFGYEIKEGDLVLISLANSNSYKTTGALTIGTVSKFYTDTWDEPRCTVVDKNGHAYKNVLKCRIIKVSSIVEAYNKAEGNTKEFYNQYNKGE